MRKYLLILVLAFLLPMAESCAEADQPVSTSDNTGRSTTVFEKRSCWEGAFYSVFCGAAFHGAGCFYAQSPKTGCALLATEAIGIGLAIVGIAINISDAETTDVYHDEDKGVEYVMLGALIFGGTWIADFVATQTLIRRHNAEIERDAHRISMTLGTSGQNNKTFTIGLAYSF
ncbi:MAG: hypothetical protein ABIK83_11585 [Candidatus Zixiibacteriota bacterium]